MRRQCSWHRIFKKGKTCKAVRAGQNVLIMLKFVRNCFRGLISFLLWLTLFLYIIGGFIGGMGLGKFFGIYRDDSSVEIIGGIFGMFIGLGGGLIFIIIAGGFIATILNIDENLQKIATNHTVLSNAVNKIATNSKIENAVSIPQSENSSTETVNDNCRKEDNSRFMPK